jgi:XTP/dITP diphosphohydrolase
MADFTFVTSNNHKLLTAKTVCGQFGIAFDHQATDIVEIQADDGAVIALDKARQAFELVKGPVAVTDDNWAIPALNGFPGPYMRYMNQWLTPADWLNLTRDLEDRRINMRHVIAYKDRQAEKIFSVEIKMKLLKEVRGTSPIDHFAIISADGIHSVAETESNSGKTVFSDQPNAWHQLCDWLKSGRPT